MCDTRRDGEASALQASPDETGVPLTNAVFASCAAYLTLVAQRSANFGVPTSSLGDLFGVDG